MDQPGTAGGKKKKKKAPTNANQPPKEPTVKKMDPALMQPKP
jgi:hypothetical protein